MISLRLRSYDAGVIGVSVPLCKNVRVHKRILKTAYVKVFPCCFTKGWHISKTVKSMTVTKFELAFIRCCLHKSVLKICRFQNLPTKLCSSRVNARSLRHFFHHFENISFSRLKKVSTVQKLKVHPLIRRLFPSPIKDGFFRN